jgi:hypothetical protein
MDQIKSDVAYSVGMAICREPSADFPLLLCTRQESVQEVGDGAAIHSFWNSNVRMLRLRAQFHNSCMVYFRSAHSAAVCFHWSHDAELCIVFQSPLQVSNSSCLYRTLHRVASWLTATFFVYASLTLREAPASCKGCRRPLCPHSRAVSLKTEILLKMKLLYTCICADEVWLAMF